MKATVLMMVIAGLAGSVAKAAAVPGPAAVAAERWVTFIDDGDYGRSWSEVGALFKKRISQDEWAHQVAKARDPLGHVVSRAFGNENRRATLPGAPDGDYDLVTFNTEFTSKKAALETIILAREGDVWRVDGYFIR